MNEFDDHLALVQIISKEKDLVPRDFAIPSFLKDSYEYLLRNYLFSQYDIAKLKNKVIETYIDRLKANSEHGDYIPSNHEIADLIDYENMEIIVDFYSNYKESFDGNVEDIIIGNYIQEITMNLTDWVTSILKAEGYPVDTRSILQDNKSKKEFDEMYAPQNIMFYEFLY